jgi:hypothetical protein
MKEVASCSQSSSAAHSRMYVHVCACSDLLYFNLQHVCVSERCGDTHMSDKASQQLLGKIQQNKKEILK